MLPQSREDELSHELIHAHHLRLRGREVASILDFFAAAAAISDRAESSLARIREPTTVLNRASRLKLVLNIGAFIAFAMAEGTRYAKIDDAIKSLNEFRKGAETQIHDLSNTIMRFMQAVDQRLEDRGEHIRHTEEPAVNTNHSSNNQYRSMKIDVPRFDGTNIFGLSLSWFKWMHFNGFIESWKGILKALNLRFGYSMSEDYRGALSKLQQTSSVANYQTKFEDLSTKVNGLSEQVLIRFFISSLTPEIKREWLVAQPQSLLQAMALARL
ncbi:hypothetical protein Acr_03g0014300 [Actinidia rufa]|uniref:Retrotransposon gag domain-containing protein n=1 Tax=Actinidia rufa TaxID=165716 RepID=A0A7J0EEQ7_9ERIC|nr:hypothetical protein Acr_03g0014300 [Actinidia rufa]